MLIDGSPRIQKYLNSTYNLTKSLREMVREMSSQNEQLLKGEKEGGSLLWLWHMTSMQSLLESWAASCTLSFPLKPGPAEEPQSKA